MKAALYEKFQAPITIEEVADPTPPPDGVVVAVKANGICRSDWHGWMGHDPDITPPHVPGHELAGDIVAVGKDVSRWRVGDPVTVPFVVGCGTCLDCQRGDHQVCADQFQPGFTAWGSFAQYVALPRADVNLVAIPESLSYVDAASLGCRFTTSFRAVVAQGRVQAGEWVAVFGCGGVGLSAIMIAAASGAQVIGVDIDDDKLAFAASVGALHTINARSLPDVVEAIHEVTQSGAHLAIDALGSVQTCRQSILSLRRRGRHVQVGLMLGDDADPPLPMGRVIAWELELYGSHGIQAYAFPQMLDLIASGRLTPGKLVQRTVSLEESCEALMTMDQFQGLGVTVIDTFD